MTSLHPDMQTVMERMEALRAGLPNRYTLPYPQARRQFLQERLPWLADGPACVGSNVLVSHQGRTFNLCKVTPESITDDALLIYLHGGGWCVGSSATHDNIIRRLAFALQCPAWSIDYALAPEAPYPAGLLDCIAAINLAVRRHPVSRLILAGDSAGAHLALAAALHLRDQRQPVIDALLLFYGVYTDACISPSMAAYGDGCYGLSVAAHQRYLDACFGPQGSKARNDAFALHCGVKLGDLPRTWITVAELDILCDQSHALAQKLEAARVPVTVNEVPGMIHGFLSYAQGLPQAGEALTAAARWACSPQGRAMTSPARARRE